VVGQKVEGVGQRGDLLPGSPAPRGVQLLELIEGHGVDVARPVRGGRHVRIVKDHRDAVRGEAYVELYDVCTSAEGGLEGD
jgi:hypothetical protein